MKKAFLFFVCFVSVCAFFSLRQFSARVESALQIERSAEISNYDIRTEKNEAAQKALAKFREQAGLNLSAQEAVRQKMRGGEADLRRRVSSLNIEYGERLQIPEVIAPDVSRSGNEWLTAPGNIRHTGILRSFIKQNSALFGLGEGQINALKTTAAYTNPDGNLSFAHLEQEINGLRVFQGEVKAGFTRKGEIVRVINNLAPSLDYQKLSTEAEISAETAVGEAAKSIGVQISERDTKRLETASNDKKVSFERGQFADETTVEKIYFPTEIGAARLAWRILLWQKSDAFDMIIDARDGTLLWRKNITNYQTQPSTYNVYYNFSNLMRTADSPTPFTPGCVNPNNCPPPPIIGRPAPVIIGNEPPYTFNTLGWIPDGENRTIGNNAEAGIDRDGINGVDPQGYAFGSPNRNFVYNYNPAPGNPPPGEEPLPPQPQTYPPSRCQQGSVTNAFYVTNRFHDQMYLFGFTEAARNFQNDNFGRGGVGGDSISVEVQDSSGTNGGNFAVATDGNRGRLQLFLWTAPTPDRDGALDNQMIVHELTHGLSSRLHGNASGLSSNMAGGMGEGWSDFYSLALLSEPDDNLFGTYSIGGYQTAGVVNAPYYYGLRRFPTALKQSTAANGLPHNPLTFGNINAGNCANFPSAFPPNPIIGGNCDQIHNIGEIWTLALWETRAQLIFRHGATEGNRRVLQYVTDAMKLAPLNPTLLQERDAMLIATQILDPGDVAAVWRGFAIRGLGSGASIQNAGTGANNTVVTEAFNIPAQYKRVRADFDGDRKTDVSVYRPSEGIWYLNRSTAGFTAFKWGIATDVLAPGDFDGDGKTDLSVFRASDDSSQPDFCILRSADSTFMFVSWGITGDEPVVGDYDGDGKDDAAVFRDSTPAFYVLKSSGGFLGVPVESLPGSFVPVAVNGDFDGDGKADFTIRAPGTNGNNWIIRKSTVNYNPQTIVFADAGDRTAVADYDGDGSDDLATFHPGSGIWSIRKSSTSAVIYIQFGIASDIVAPGDYDGDGKADQAVYRNGVWYLNQSTAGFAATQFGIASDIPIPSRYQPQ